jgi:hypothetical protein
MLLGYDSGGNLFVPAIVIVVNLLVVLAILILLGDRLESFLLKIIEVYLLVVPVLLVD